MASKMEWVDGIEKRNEEEKGKDYFNMQEGDNRFQLLSHCAPLALKWIGTKYVPAEEGGENISIKGVCWVLQDGMIKSAKLPYTVVKAIKGLMEDPDYAFEEFPMPRFVNVKAKGAGTKEVEYTIIPSPKEVEISEEILTELSKKPTPEEIIEKIKNKVVSQIKPIESPEDEINPEDVPF